MEIGLIYLYKLNELYQMKITVNKKESFFTNQFFQIDLGIFQIKFIKKQLCSWNGQYQQV